MISSRIASSERSGNGVHTATLKGRIPQRCGVNDHPALAV
jgi:hypothetical protein